MTIGFGNESKCSLAQNKKSSSINFEEDSHFLSNRSEQA